MGSHEIAHRFLAANDGVVRRDHLLAMGVDCGWLRRRVRAGELREYLPGIVGLPHEPTGTERLRAALLFGGEGSRLSHTTAAHLLALRSAADDTIHVTVPHGRSRRTPAGLRLHQARHTAHVVLGSLPIVPREQTLVDLLAVLDLDELRFVATEGVRRALVSASDLHSQVRVPRSASRSWHRLLEEIDAGALSGGEARDWRAVHDAGLPLPQLNAPFRHPAGRYFIDALWPDYRLGVEIDGYTVHAGRDSFESDRTRQNRVHIGGVLLIRFTVAQVMQAPIGVVDTTREALIARSLDLRLPARLRRRLH